MPSTSQLEYLVAVHKAGNFETLRGLVDRVGGCTLIPESCARSLPNDVRRGQVRPFRGAVPTREVSIAARRLPPPARATEIRGDLHSGDVDEDCDTLADDDDDSTEPVTMAELYADLDGDGFGDGDALGIACDAGDGAAFGDGDCDDALQACFPAPTRSPATDSMCRVRIPATPTWSTPMRATPKSSTPKPRIPKLRTRSPRAMMARRLRARSG
jgi:hypothetical protein